MSNILNNKDEVISKVEREYNSDKSLISVDIPHLGFVYNQHNVFDFGTDNFYIAPRITKHFPKKIYGHCNFQTYGKTKKLKTSEAVLYHFAFVGLKRFTEKTTVDDFPKNKILKFIDTYENNLKLKNKYINITHYGFDHIKSKAYENKEVDDFLNIFEKMINDLNIIGE